MAIHIPGPRLFSGIRFRHLAQVGAGGARPSANIDINLTPFVDMMTILVTFLLMVFSASGEIVSNQAGLELPVAAQRSDLQQAPIIIVTRQSITFNGEHMVETDTVGANEATQWKIIELYERLKAERKMFEINFEKLPESQQKRCTKPDPKDSMQCDRGLAILQADKAVQAKVINRVLKTANAAGFTNIMFAVERQGGGPAGG